MKVSNKGGLFFSGFLLIVVLYLIFTALGYEPKARIFPIGAGLATFALLVLVLLHDFYPVPFLGKLNVDLTEVYRIKERSDDTERNLTGRKFVLILCWLFGFFLLIFIFGFNVGIFLFVLIFFKAEAKLGWAKSLLKAALIWGSIYTIFELVMGFTLFKGWIFGEVLPQI